MGMNAHGTLSKHRQIMKDCKAKVYMVFATFILSVNMIHDILILFFIVSVSGDKSSVNG